MILHGFQTGWDCFFADQGDFRKLVLLFDMFFCCEDLRQTTTQQVLGFPTCKEQVVNSLKTQRETGCECTDASLMVATCCYLGMVLHEVWKLGFFEDVSIQAVDYRIGTNLQTHMNVLVTSTISGIFFWIKRHHFGETNDLISNLYIWNRNRSFSICFWPVLSFFFANHSD